MRKAQLSLGSAASNDSGFGSGGLEQQGRHSVRHLSVKDLEKLTKTLQVDAQRQCSESPTLPPRRRYHQHYHRQHGASLVFYIQREIFYRAQVSLAQHTEHKHTVPCLSDLYKNVLRHRCASSDEEDAVGLAYFTM